MNEPTPPVLHRVEPILLSRDLDRTAQFYDKLGFQPVGRFADYLIVQRDEVRLHFTRWAELDPDANSCACYVYVSGVKALYELWLHVGVIHPKGALHQTDYGLWEFAAIDDDKNLLRVGEPIGN